MSQHLPISGFSARSMCPIHVLAFMSQHLCISGSSARSMSPDPCLNIHIYLRSFCKIHVSDSCLIASLSSDFVALRRRNANFDLRRRVLCGPAGKTVRPRSAGAFRAGETQILSSGDAFCVALRRENSPTECFAQAKREF